MNVGLLGFLLLATGILSLASFLNGWKKRYSIPILLAFACNITLMVGFQSQPWKVARTFYLKPSIVNDTQVISFVGLDGRNHLINLNQKFGKLIYPSYLIKVTEYSTGPYFGIYCVVGDTKYEIHDPPHEYFIKRMAYNGN